MDAVLAGEGSLSERMAAALPWIDEHLGSDPETVRRLVDALLPEAEAAGDLVDAAWLRFQRGWLAIDADDFQNAFVLLGAAKATFEELGEKAGLSRCLNAIGVAHRRSGAFDLAIDKFKESVTVAESIERSDLVGASSRNMARALCDLGEFDEALKIIECNRGNEVSSFNLPALHGLAGRAYHGAGRLREAEAELLESIKATGESVHDGLPMKELLAQVYIDQGRLDDAERLLDECLGHCRDGKERTVATLLRLTNARLLSRRGRAGESIGQLQAALALALELKNPKLEADVQKALYASWQACGEFEKALGAYVRHSTLMEDLKGEQTMRRIMGLYNEQVRSEARHFETLYRQISAISEIGQRITANLQLESTLQTVYSSVNKLMDAPTLLIALVNEAGDALDYRLVILRGERQAPFRLPLSDDTFGTWCVRNGAPIFLNDAATEYGTYVKSIKRIREDSPIEKSLIFVPLFSGSKVVGVFSVQSSLPNAYDKRQLETVRAIGSYVAIAIENSKLFRRIEELATTDGLTGLHNRRRAVEVLEDACRKARRYPPTTGVIMADIDEFKKVND